jgi:peptide/nickel transport system substrate-binding protein
VGWARLQFRDPDAPWVRDVRVRQALQHILDRQALADTFSPDGGPADIFAPKGDPVYQLAEQRGFPKYPYDISRAQALLRDAGWTLGSDGLVHNAAGQTLNFEVRVVSRTEEGLALADQWKQGGINAEMYAMGKPLSSRNDLKAANKGAFWMADSAVPDTFQFFRTSQIASDANGWAGRNLGGYSNPDYDRQYDQLVTELNPMRFVSEYADFVRWTARELPFIVAYYEVSSNMVAFKGPIRGPVAPAAVSRVGTWNIQNWEMD